MKMVRRHIIIDVLYRCRAKMAHKSVHAPFSRERVNTECGKKMCSVRWIQNSTRRIMSDWDRVGKNYFILNMIERCMRENLHFFRIRLCLAPFDSHYTLSRPVLNDVLSINCYVRRAGIIVVQNELVRRVKFNWFAKRRCVFDVGVVTSEMNYWRKIEWMCDTLTSKVMYSLESLSRTFHQLPSALRL